MTDSIELALGDINVLLNNNTVLQGPMSPYVAIAVAQEYRPKDFFIYEPNEDQSIATICTNYFNISYNLIGTSVPSNFNLLICDWRYKDHLTVRSFPGVVWYVDPDNLIRDRSEYNILPKYVTHAKGVFHTTIPNADIDRVCALFAITKPEEASVRETAHGGYEIKLSGQSCTYTIMGDEEGLCISILRGHVYPVLSYYVSMDPAAENSIHIPDSYQPLISKEMLVSLTAWYRKCVEYYVSSRKSQDVLGLIELIYEHKYHVTRVPSLDTHHYMFQAVEKGRHYYLGVDLYHETVMLRSAWTPAVEVEYTWYSSSREAKLLCSVLRSAMRRMCKHDIYLRQYGIAVERLNSNMCQCEYYNDNMYRFFTFHGIVVSGGIPLQVRSRINSSEFRILDTWPTEWYARAASFMYAKELAHICKRHFDAIQREAKRKPAADSEEATS